jgi:hypothetical protein
MCTKNQDAKRPAKATYFSRTPINGYAPKTTTQQRLKPHTQAAAEGCSVVMQKGRIR